ncbi:MAG TPA: carboxypeptidase-like regulatory domain-containing protein, partial [Planctomycetota bacterium]|nr:carboxypeptidase-like regulatory domain-containing protein [Planctomycetota bacterium]
KPGVQPQPELRAAARRSEAVDDRREDAEPIEASVTTQDERRASAPAERDPATATATGTLALEIVDQDSGIPVPRAQAALWTRNDDDTGWRLDHGSLERADAQGRINLPARSGVLLHYYAAPPREDAGATVSADVAPLTEGEQRTLRVALPTPHEIVFWGRLVTTPEKRPIAGARVEANDRSQTDARDRSVPAKTLASAISNEVGLFEVRVPDWERPWLRIEAPPHAPRVVTVNHDHDVADKALEIPLDEGASLRVVLTRAGGESIDGSTVWAGFDAHRVGRMSDERIFTYLDRTAVPDERGECLFTGLPPRVPISVDVEIDGRILRNRDPIVLTTGEVRTWERHLGEEGAIVGTMVDALGDAVASRNVWVVPRSGHATARRFGLTDDSETVARGKTDERGRFRVADVPAGDYWVGPSFIYSLNLSKRAIAPVAIPVTVPTSGDLDVFLTVHRGLFVEGRVVDADGAAVRGALVSVSSKTIERFVCTSKPSDADGRFRAGPLVPGEFVVQATVGMPLHSKSRRVRARAGDREVVLRLRAESSSPR